MEDEIICRICLDQAIHPVHLCEESKNHDVTCQDCLIRYVEEKVSSSLRGTCPALHCPCHSHNIMSYSKLGEILPTEDTRKYQTLADSLLIFLCGGCHVSKTIAVGFNPENFLDVHMTLLKLLQETCTLNESDFVQTKQQFLENKHSYNIGRISAGSFFNICKQCLPTIVTGDDGASYQVMVHVLQLIANPERRNVLHLRYLNERPRFYTPCCSRLHCFRCKTKDFHEGASCEENTAHLDSSIVPCPNCNISLAKADGCNAVSCVCGAQFSWTSELDVTRRAAAFQATFAKQTSRMCASVLCASTPGNVDDARGWQRRHRVSVDAELLQWWRAAHPRFPSQQCVILRDVTTEGVVESRALWTLHHQSEVKRCELQSELSIDEVFLSSCVPAERELVAFHVLNTTSAAVDPVMMRSIKRWAMRHPDAMTEAGHAYAVRAANQFLVLYGAQLPQRVDHEDAPGVAMSAVPHPRCWEADISNPTLVFSEDHMSVTRPGSMSCYPAAFAVLPGPEAVMSIKLINATQSSNWITFGLVRVGFTASSSDGVGRAQNSWGLCDDRSQSCHSPCTFLSCGTTLQTFRKLVEGDTLTARVDVTAGWLEMTVNDTEFKQVFDIPGGNSTEYLFAVTMANDHTVRIVDESYRACGAYCLSNPQHIDNFTAYIRYLKQLASAKGIDDTLLQYSRLWEAHGSDDAKRSFDEVEDVIDRILSGSDISEFFPLHPRLTWKNIMYAVSWRTVQTVNRDLLMEMDTANNFYADNGASSPFVAAAVLYEYHIQNISDEERHRALCFMKVYADEQNLWYDYNDSLEESTLSGSGRPVAGCRCLPRHFKTCPRNL